MLTQSKQRNKVFDREGSPWTGIGAVMAKEMADQLTGARMRILEILILITAAGTIFNALQTIQSDTSQSTQFLYLKLFTASKDPLPAFVGFLGFLVPLIAIALSFDSINGEFNRRTLSRVLAQPVYRDAFLMGKFLACFSTLAVFFSAIWLLIFGVGIMRLGVPPTSEETWRALMFLVVTIFYGGIWTALALLFSTIFRSPATAALASISVWLFFTIFWNIVAGLIFPVLAPKQVTSLDEYLAAGQTQVVLERISPSTLYAEAAFALLQPSARSLGFVLPIQLDRAVMGTSLPFDQSLILIWPHLTGLIATTILLFAIAYVIFQRQEIRA